MRIILEQHTAPWHLWRAGGVGGSDAPIIMGCRAGDESWPTVEDLIAEKLGKTRREESFAMRRGRKLEPAIRKALEIKTGLILRPRCVQHNQTPWLRASLDGSDFWGKVIAELKAPNVVDHEIALGGVVPRHYFPQVQHVLAASDADVCLYASYSVAERFGGEPSLAVIEVRHNAEYQAELLAREEEFWNRVLAARQEPRIAQGTERAVG
jgi:putative phage-type endonuclease